MDSDNQNTDLNSDSRVIELEKLIETILVTESQRFLEIDRLRVAKLERLRNVEADLECQRSERELALEILAKERDLNAGLVEQNRLALSRLESLSAKFNAEKADLLNSAENSARSGSNRAAELESDLRRSEEVIESLRIELSNMNDSSGVLEVENKSLRSALATKQADFNLHIDKLKRELTELGTTKEKVITDQRALIDQLSNSMSEAATQLMDSQNTSKYHQTDIETRDRRITALEEKIVWLEDNVRDRTDRLIEQEDASKELSKRIDQLIREKEIILAQLDGAMDDLTQKAALIDSMESQRKKSDLIQTNLVSELQSLPIINKRLESDCAFLREDLKAVSEKLKGVLKDHELLSARLKIVDSILSPEQRLRVNERSTGPLVKSEASAVSENKRLQIEAMELRMRLVDSQAARDKAQSQLIDQSQLIAKLQKDLRYPGDENVLLRNK